MLAAVMTLPTARMRGLECVSASAPLTATETPKPTFWTASRMPICVRRQADVARRGPDDRVSHAQEEHGGEG